MQVKRSVLFLILLLVFSISFSGFALAEEEICCSYSGPADEPLYEWRLSENCQSPEGAIFGDKIVDDDFCKSKFEEDPYYMCEDMNQEDCENAKGCESIFGPSLCEGEGAEQVCTTDYVWKSCAYEGDEFFEDYEDEELEKEAGTKPGDAFYFLDRFFDRFGDELEVKEEKIAEIKEMVEEGDIEGAKIALEEYMKLAEELEHEIDPERREEAIRSAAAIRAAMKDIRDQLPPGERGAFVSEVMSKEHSIATAAEIAGKIKELCEQLSELDPMEYSRMCRTDDDAPKWKKKLDRDLSAEQEKTAKEFVNIMKQCFKTSGQDCACEEIPFYDFSIACSKAAPLAVACDIEGDELACDDLENLEMPELPDWLQPIWEDLEDDMEEAQYDMHMPRECIEVGATTRNDCAVVMVKNNAPIECRSALVRAAEDGEVDRRVFEEICDKIMMELHAPDCAEKGITDPEECARYMDSFRGEDRRDGPGFGMDCTKIEDPTERLECYDNKGNEMGNYYGPRGDEVPEGEITWQCKENRIHWPPDCETFMREEWPEQERKRMEEGELRRANEEDWRIKEQECAASCDLENGWWDFRNGVCECYTTSHDDYKEYYDYEDEGGSDYQESECKDGCDDECPGASRTDCINNYCECYYEDDSSSDSGSDEGTSSDSGSSEESSSEETSSEEEGTTEESSSSESSSSEEESSSGGEESGGEESSSDGGDNTGGDVTGAVISGNVFLDYYYN